MLTPDERAYVQRWLESYEGAANDPRYTFGWPELIADMKKRADLLRRMLDAK